MSPALFLFLSPIPNHSQFPSNSNSLSNSSIRILNPQRIHSFKPPPISTTTTTATTNHPDHSISSQPVSGTDAAIKMPTAPWMKGPLLLSPMKSWTSQSKTKKVAGSAGAEKPDRSLTEKIMQSIVKLQETHTSDETQENTEEFEFGVSLEGIGEMRIRESGKMPWLKTEKVVFRRTKKEKVVTAAELTLDPMLLERLRGEAVKMRKWVKVKKAGVTESVVDQIHMVWKSDELAMVKFDMPLCRNMDRAREILEIKTRGLVIWSKKDTLVVYRGSNYQSTSKHFQKMRPGLVAGADASNSKLNQSNFEDDLTISEIKFHESTTGEKMGRKDGEEDSSPTGIFMEEMVDSQPVNGSLYEREADRLLDGLGPRFIDWWRPKPLPVDADLLPEVLPGFRPPFRLSPPQTRSKLTDDELTYLRKLAYALPTHFVLGRNRKLQGLAAAILKLWEKSLIVKIAIKWGIPNTKNEQMANELKASLVTRRFHAVNCLTGGVLLLRNKFFIILYRGKDFLPCRVANLIVEREMEFKGCQIREEDARLKAIETSFVTDEPLANTSTTGTLSELKLNWKLKRKIREGTEKAGAQAFHCKLKRKIERSAKVLAKLNSAWRPADHDRECFRKIGQKMDSSLLLGRRGVFDGVIEGLHQHWKHREIVKVITMQRSFSQVLYTAKLLESESGGVLVSIDKLKEGHAIIIYRGKNYRRPIKLVPKNLLTKREALNRSLEMQRIGSLKFFAYQRQQAISDLKLKLADLQKGSRRIDQRESEKFTKHEPPDVPYHESYFQGVKRCGYAIRGESSAHHPPS
ncbi:hypothetical protein AAG906_018351 [Vitis piasezkii]